MTLSEIITQLESCGYTCEGGPLELNIAWLALKDLEKQQWVWDGVVEVGGIHLSKEVVEEIVLRGREE